MAALVCAAAASNYSPPAHAQTIVAEPAASEKFTTNLVAPGTRFATPCYVHDSGMSGPTLFIVGGEHGNEPAGAAAAEAIWRWPITRGKIVAVPRANVPGLAANKRLIPDLHTNLANLNRNYPRAGKEEGPRGEIATAIWDAALKSRPDWVLDLHEGYDFSQMNKNSVGSSILVFPNQKGRSAADRMLAAVNAGITDPKLKFVRRGMPIDGSLARAAGEHLEVPSMTLETTAKQPLAKRILQHEVIVYALLHQLGMMDGTIPGQFNISEQAAMRDDGNGNNHIPVRIALYEGPGTGGAGLPSLMKRLDHAPDSSITMVTPDDIGSDTLTNYDVVIFAGGSGSKQAEALGDAGRGQVRQFVEHGGGYIGICAGAYLAISGFPWSLNLINARAISSKWQRGRGDVKVELTGLGSGILGERAGQFDVHYANGPIVTNAYRAGLPALEVLAYFRTERAEHGAPVGIMVGSPAIFTARYREGTVVCISPHPEQTPGLEEIVPRAVAWVASQRKAARKTISRAE